MSKFLVTGGAGFVGSNIVEHLLEAGECVRVIDNFATGHRRNLPQDLARIEFIEGDIALPSDCAQAVEGMDYVLHQAAIPSVPRSVAHPVQTHEANCTGTLNLLLAARDAKVKRFVYAASSSAYGNQQAEYKIETMRAMPLSPYAVQKLSGENYMRAFSECFGMETVSLRYFNIFGPRQDPNSPYSAVMPLFISAVLDNKRPTVHGDGLQTRDFTFVENVVRANVLAAQGDFAAQGQVYNIACGEAHSVLGVLAGVNAALGAEVEPQFEGARVGDVRDSLADISRARADLGYEVKVPFEEGLQRTVAWYKEHRSFLQRGSGL